MQKERIRFTATPLNHYMIHDFHKKRQDDFSVTYTLSDAITDLVYGGLIVQEEEDLPIVVPRRAKRGTGGYGKKDMEVYLLPPVVRRIHAIVDAQEGVSVANVMEHICILGLTYFIKTYG